MAYGGFRISEPNYDAMWEAECAAWFGINHEGYWDGWHGKVSQACREYGKYREWYINAYQHGQRERQQGKRFREYSWSHNTPAFDPDSDFAVPDGDMDDIPF